MAVKIKLKRLGKIRAPYYRIIVADARTKREGRAIEELGKYHPKEEPSFIEVNSERVQYWLGVGAQPTDPVLALLKVTGDWQRFKGEPAPPAMKVAEPKPNKLAAFEAAAKEAGEQPKEGATTAKGRGRRSDKKAEAAKAEAPKAETAKAEVAEEKATEKAEAPEKPEKAEKAEKGEKGEKAEAPEKPEKPEKAGKGEKAEAPEKPEKAEKGEKKASGGRKASTKKSEEKPEEKAETAAEAEPTQGES